MKTWNQISKKLEKKLSQDEFNTWIRPLQGEFKENSLEISAPNDFVLNYVSNNLKNHIYEVLASKDTKIIDLILLLILFLSTALGKTFLGVEIKTPSLAVKEAATKLLE